MPIQRRDHKEMERRRKRAAVMFEKGYPAAEVARRLGVSRQAATRWKNAWSQGGNSALVSKGAAGRKPRLAEDQCQQIIDALLTGPVVRGYRTNLWTLPRVALLIKDLTGVCYHPGHVWHLLRALNFSCQRPTRRALERDEQKIAHWKRYVWPNLKKKAAQEGRTVVFLDESGLSTRPHRVRTWAPRGQTPVIQETFGWKSLSVIAGITLWNFYFQIHPGAIKSPQVIEFLKALLRHLQTPLLILWDGAAIHRSKLVKEFVATTQGRLEIATLPAYAPELNPAEYLWAHLKEHEIGNLIVRHAWELSRDATAALRRMRRRPKIILACFAQADLWP